MTKCSDLIGLALFWQENVTTFEQEGKMDAFHGSSNISCFTAMSGILPFTALFCFRSSVPLKTGFTVYNIFIFGPIDTFGYDLISLKL